MEYNSEQLLRDLNVVKSAGAVGVNPDTMFKIRDVGERSGANAVSPAGAVGRWQLMPSISKQYGVDPRDENASAVAAAKLIADTKAEYARRFPGRTDAEYESAAIAHYNGGWKGGTAILQGKQPPQKETRDYVNRINSAGDGKVGGAAEGTGAEGTGADLLQFLQKQGAASTPASTPAVPPVPSVSPPAPAVPQTPVKAPLMGQGYRDPRNVSSRMSEGGKVFFDAASRALTAGAYDPRLSTPAQRSANPVAELGGSVVGTAPYAFVPGGLPVQMGVMGARGATQAALEGGGAKGAIVSGVLEGAAPGVGAAGGAVVKGGAKLVKQAVEGAAGKMFYPGAQTGAELASDIVTQVNKGNLKAARSSAAEILDKTNPKLMKDVLENGLDASSLNAKYPTDSMAIRVLLNARAEAQKAGTVINSKNYSDFISAPALKALSKSPSALTAFNTVNKPLTTGDVGRKAVADVVQSVLGNAAVGGIGGGTIGALSGGDVATGALLGTAAGVANVALLKSIITNAPQTSGKLMTTIAKYLPQQNVTRADFISAYVRAAEKTGEYSQRDLVRMRIEDAPAAYDAAQKMIGGVVKGTARAVSAGGTGTMVSGSQLSGMDARRGK